MAKLTYEYVKYEIEKAGYTLESKIYLGSTQTLKICCDKGHRYQVKWCNFNRGHRCRKCNQASRSEYRKKENIKIAESLGYKIVNYGSRAKIDFLCPEGHEFRTAWSRFCNKEKDEKCPFCLADKRHKGGKVRVYYIRLSIESGEILWKIGQTTKEVDEKLLRQQFKVIKIWEFDKPSEGMLLKQKLLKENPNYRYRGKAMRDGNTDCYTRDVLGIDCIDDMDKVDSEIVPELDMEG